MTLLASCPPELRVDSIVTAEDWGRLEPYLRESFEIPTSVKIGLQGKVLFSGKQALFFKVRDQPTLSTARFQIERLGQLLVDARVETEAGCGAIWRYLALDSGAIWLSHSISFYPVLFCVDLTKEPSALGLLIS